MADNNQIIGATIQIDTGNSKGNVVELNKETSALKGNLKDIGATSKTTGKDIAGTSENFKNLKENIGS
jgi:hypothetical protein